MNTTTRKFGTKLSINNMVKKPGEHSKQSKGISKGLTKQQPLQLRTTNVQVSSTTSMKTDKHLTAARVHNNHVASKTSKTKQAVSVGGDVKATTVVATIGGAAHVSTPTKATASTAAPPPAPSTAAARLHQIPATPTVMPMSSATTATATPSAGAGAGAGAGAARRPPAALKQPSTAVKKFNESVQRARRLIVEAKVQSKSTNAADWARAVECYAAAASLLPERISTKLHMKIENLRERMAGAEDEDLVKQHILRAKKYIVEAKTKSKSLHHDEWTVAIELYSQARDLLPPHLGNKLSKKINALTTKITKAKAAARAAEEEDDDDEDDDEVDLFSDAMFDLTDVFAWKAEAPAAAAEAPVLEEEEEEEEEIAIPMVTATPMKQAPTLVFDRFGSVGAEVFALALGRSYNLRVNTQGAQELLEMLRAVDACETDILGTSDHALKVSWRKVAGRTKKKKRVHFCTFDLSTVSPPEKWSEISDKKEKLMNTNAQEKLAHNLSLVLATARECLIMRNSNNSQEDKDEQNNENALAKFLVGLEEISKDETVTTILRKGADFFLVEFGKLQKGVMPFVEKFDKAATSSMRYHLRCLFNTKPDSITTKPMVEHKEDKNEGKNNTKTKCKNDENDENDKNNATSLSLVEEIAIDSDGSYGYCGREDIAAIVHRALREHNGSLLREKDADDDVDSYYADMEATRFLYELLTHPGTKHTHKDKASTWASMKTLSMLIAPFADVCPSLVHSIVPLASDPHAFVRQLVDDANTTCKPMFQRLTTLDSISYSKYVSSFKNKNKKKSSKRSKKEDMSENSVYITTKAPYRFKYPKLNCRGDTDAIFGSIASNDEDEAAEAAAAITTWYQEATSLVLKIKKCQRKSEKPSRFFEKGLASVIKSLKNKKYVTATKFATAFIAAVNKNQKTKFDTKLRDECRCIVLELFEKGLPFVLETERCAESNRCCCEICEKQVSSDGGSDGGTDRGSEGESEGGAVECEQCSRMTHKSCVLNIVQNDDRETIFNEITVWFCRECTMNGFEEMKEKKEEEDKEAKARDEAMLENEDHDE